MRINNAKVRNIILSVYFILIMLIILMTALAGTLNTFFSNSKIAYVVFPLLLAVGFFLTHYISKYFEYDSDGLQVVMVNRGLLLSEALNYREHKVEFEKNLLKGYKFSNYIFYRSLTIYLDGKQHKEKEVFNVTLVSKKKRRYIKQSLNKIVKQNKSQKQNV